MAYAWYPRYSSLEQNTLTTIIAVAAHAHAPSEVVGETVSKPQSRVFDDEKGSVMRLYRGAQRDTALANTSFTRLSLARILAS